MRSPMKTALSAEAMRVGVIIKARPIKGYLKDNIMTLIIINFYLKVK